MISLKEAENNKIISDEVIKIIPRKCKCGSDIEFTENMSELHCSNEKCKYKVIDRLVNLVKELDIKTWDYNSCEEICLSCNFESPFQIFLVKQLLDSNIEINIVNFNEKVKEIEELKKTRIELWKIVKCAGIRYVSSVANKLFDNYDTFDKAFKDIEKQQITLISEKLGITSNEVSALSLMIYNELMKHKDELLFAETQLRTIKYNINPMRVAIAGNIVDGFINKSQFIEYLNNRYYSKCSFRLDSSINDDTKILVSNRDSSSTKYRKAKKINEKYISDGIAKDKFTLEEIEEFETDRDIEKIGEKIVICNSKQLIERLDRAFK